MNLTCPACGFRTITESAYGSYEICPVCGWEDDAVQLANPCSGGGANKQSLLEFQQVELQQLDDDLLEFQSDPDWRPLSVDEVRYFADIAKQNPWTFVGDTKPESAYWRKKEQLG